MKDRYNTHLYQIFSKEHNIKTEKSARTLPPHAYLLTKTHIHTETHGTSFHTHKADLHICLASFIEIPGSVLQREGGREDAKKKSVANPSKLLQPLTLHQPLPTAMVTFIFPGI